jgi:hypothetical protein
MARTVTMESSSADALFKELYGSGADQNLVNKKTPLASILMKNKRVDFVGDQFVQPVRFGSAVGLGYRSVGENLPAPVAAPRGRAVFSAKRAYATAEYDREAIKASRNEKGAFAKVTVDEAEATVEGFNLHLVERPLFGDSTGALGEVESKTGSGTSGSPWVITLENDGGAAPKPKKRYFPKGAKLDCYTQAGVLNCTVAVVSATSTTVTVTLDTSYSANAPANEDVLYWEGSKGKEIVGMASIAPSSDGTLYGISQASNPNFKGIVSSISGALVYDDLNDIVSDLEEESESPDLAVCSHAALALLKNQSEELKRYSAAEVKSSDGKIGFKGIELMTAEGPIPLIASQMCPDDEIILLNKKYMQLVMREDFGWFDDDGTILMRDQNKDVYNARYGGYYELFCSKPNTVARLKGFTV